MSAPLLQARSSSSTSSQVTFFWILISFTPLGILSPKDLLNTGWLKVMLGIQFRKKRKELIDLERFYKVNPALLPRTNQGVEAYLNSLPGPQDEWRALEDKITAAGLSINIEKLWLWGAPTTFIAKMAGGYKLPFNVKIGVPSNDLLVIEDYGSVLDDVELAKAEVFQFFVAQTRAEKTV